MIHFRVEGDKFDGIIMWLGEGHETQQLIGVIAKHFKVAESVVYPVSMEEADDVIELKGIKENTYAGLALYEDPMCEKIDRQYFERGTSKPHNDRFVKRNSKKSQW